VLGSVFLTVTGAEARAGSFADHAGQSHWQPAELRDTPRWNLQAASPLS